MRIRDLPDDIQRVLNSFIDGVATPWTMTLFALHQHWRGDLGLEVDTFIEWCQLDASILKRLVRVGAQVPDCIPVIMNHDVLMEELINVARYKYSRHDGGYTK